MTLEIDNIDGRRPLCRQYSPSSLPLLGNCISNSNNAHRMSRFRSVILNLWSTRKWLKISVDLEHRGLTRSKHGSLRDCMHDLQHDRHSTCKHQFALHFYKLGMIYHTGWLPGNLLFERFASVGSSQPHLVSFWFVFEVQGCSCLLPCSISAFISATWLGNCSLVKFYALHAIQ